jgi:hypothetical protein
MSLKEGGLPIGRELLVLRKNEKFQRRLSSLSDEMQRLVSRCESNTLQLGFDLLHPNSCRDFIIPNPYEDSLFRVLLPQCQINRRVAESVQCFSPHAASDYGSEGTLW